MKKICINCKSYEDCFNASAGIEQIKEDGTCSEFEGNEEYIIEEEEAKAKKPLVHVPVTIMRMDKGE